MEQELEVRGAGHVILSDGRGIPGQYANCRLVLDEAGQVLRVEPLVPPEPSVLPQEQTSEQEQTSVETKKNGRGGKQP